MLRKPRQRILVAALAGLVVLGIGAVTLPAAFAEDTGTIAGTFTDGGNPVPNAFVTAYDTNFGYRGNTMTDSSGAFQITGLLAGGYKLQFYVDGFEQWSSQKSSFFDASVITVVGGQTTTVEEVIRPYGNISGHVYNTDGSPAANVQISALGSNGGTGGIATTDSTGLYTVRYLAEGQYQVQFRRDWSSPIQWAHNATTYEQAAFIGVTAGATTTLDQTFLPVATVTGTLTEGGAPAANVQLSFRRAGSYDSYHTSTDWMGRYTVSVWPGTYTVQVNRNGLIQYLPGQIVEAQAQEYVLSEGTTVLNEQLLPTGTITGRLTLPNGSGVPWASVTVDGSAGTLFSNTDFTGSYSVRAYPGEYTVGFSSPQYGKQWENGQSSAAQADPVTVVANSSTTVDEVLGPFGTVEVTAVDSVTGAPINEFCVSAPFGFGCTTTGTVTDSDALPGHYTIDVSGNDGMHLSTIMAVDVVGGATTSVTASLTPGGSVTVTMTDKQSGALVSGACLELVRVSEPTHMGMGAGLCSDESGVVAATQLTAGTYKAFVWARDGVHGHQWVGPDGGVGQFKKARTITIAAGQSVTLGNVLLDGAGTLSGTVTDELTGDPVTGGIVALSSWDYGYGGQETMFPIDSQGRYSVPNLGPYQWTLLFWGNNGASEWMGDEVYRDKAAHVKVKEGRVTTYDTEVGAGTTVTGQVFEPDGVTPAGQARIEFVNADSADNMGIADYYLPLGPSYTAHVKGTQRVKISYSATVEGESYQGWLGGTSFADATVFTIPDGGGFTLDLVLDQP